MNGIVNYSSLMGRLGYWLFAAPFRGRFYRIGAVFSQMVRIGVQAIPMAALTALTIGAVLAMQSLDGLKSLGAESRVPELVSLSLFKELAPMLMAVIMIGRSGSAVSAELGTMRVSEEIEALEVMGIHPVSYLVVPRFLAMMVMMPVLSIFGIYMGLLGGWIICEGALGMGTSFYINQALDSVMLEDLNAALIKSAVFGFLIVTIACNTGLHVRGGAEGVGKATTASVVYSLLAVFVANAILTALIFF